MKPKTLLMLAGITLVVSIGAAFFGQEREHQPDQSGELFFPDLMNRINHIHKMTIETNNETVTLIREADTWSVKESGGYTAAFEKIKPVLIGMAELRVREPKTKNPELYEKLGLQDKDAEGSSSTLITLKTKDASTAATLLLGDQRPAKGAPSLTEMYVRKPEDPQTWLVVGNLPIEKVPGQWLDKELLKIASKRVQRVRVTHADGEMLTVYKDTPDALDFKIQDLPKGVKVGSQFNVNNVVTSLAQLQMDDVKKADKFQVETQPGIKAVLETFDGLRLTVETMQKDEVIYGKIVTAFDSALIYEEPVTESSEEKEAAKENSGIEDATELKKDANSDSNADGEKGPKPSKAKESVLKSEEDVQKEVVGFNEKLNEWVFELPKFRVDNFSKKKQDLIAKD
ncbi:MAG: hypothetical protein NPIRA04_14870 [Nitrospirales bacterium]|nr:MAG: hypothetical protein NPIRA04_14870 [Nitrospirales bacterium]